MNIDTYTMLVRIQNALFAALDETTAAQFPVIKDTENIRRIAMTLHRWHELECGVDNGCIERDETTGKAYWRNAVTGNRMPIPDRKTGAIKRLKDIMARYPTLGYYIQGDPRGAALYILQPGDIPEGETVDAFYNRGIAVHK